MEFRERDKPENSENSADMEKISMHPEIPMTDGELDDATERLLDILKGRVPTITDVGKESGVEVAMLRRPIEGNGGHWEGDRGNSVWIPDRNEVPQNPKTNPEGKTWSEILDQYGIKGIPFKNGEPDFSEISKGTVTIDNFTDNRYGKGGNFDQANAKLAEQKDCSPEEVKEWIKENKYTWHECKDGTMQKVPTDVHGNVPHSGGVAEYRNNQ